MSFVKKAISGGTILILVLMGCGLSFGQTAPAPSGQAAAPSGQAAAKPSAPVEAPFTQQELIKQVKHDKKHLDTLAPAIQSRGLDFEISSDIEQQLRKAGADDNFIANIKNYTPSARAAKAAHSTGPQVTSEEAQAYNVLKDERTPDKAIQEANDYAQKFPNSPILTYVYALEANAYQQKNDASGVVNYCEKSLHLDANNLMSLLMVASVLPQPQMMQNIEEAEKERRLNQAEGYDEKILELIDQLPKQQKESDADYQKRKNQAVSGVYSSLGMVHLQRSQMALQGPDMGELAKAEESYKNAIAKTDQPSPTDYYRLGEVYSTENKLDDAIGAFTKAGQLAQGTVIEQYSNQQVQALKQKEAQSKSSSSSQH